MGCVTDGLLLTVGAELRAPKLPSRAPTLVVAWAAPECPKHFCMSRLLFMEQDVREMSDRTGAGQA